MKQEKLSKLISESRQLLKTATPEQRLKFLAILKNNYTKLQAFKEQQVKPVVSENGDYLRED